MNRENDIQSIARIANHILDVAGRHITSDSPQLIYAEGDLSLTRDDDTVSVIFRGTLVFRYAPDGKTSDRVFEEHGAWRAEVERVARNLSGTSPTNAAT